MNTIQEKHTQRLLAWLLTLAMLLSMMIVAPAYAQGDWADLAIVLNWIDAAGNPASVQAAPVLWGDAQAFWATVPGDAPLDGMTLSIYHPGHAYTFAPGNGEPLADVLPAGDLSSQAVQITAYDENGSPADAYLLYVSYAEIPAEPAPVIGYADVTAVWRTEDGAVLNSQTVTVSSEQPQSFDAAWFDGYEFVGDRASVTVSVDAAGNISESYIEFVYRASEKYADVTVTWRTEDGAVLNSTVTSVSSSQPQTFEAAWFDGYEFVGDRASVTVSVDAAGNISESYIEFVYRASEKYADVTIIWRTEDGVVLNTATVTVSSSQPQTFEAMTFEGYSFAGDQPSETVTVGLDGVPSRSTVEFVYRLEIRSSQVHVVWTLQDGTVLAEETDTVTNELAATYYATPFTGFVFVGSEESVTVTVDASGQPSAGEVVFLYAPEQKFATITATWRAEDGLVLRQESVELTNNDIHTFDAATFDGYYLADMESSITVTMDAYGNPSQTEVEFVYAAIPVTETVAPATEVPVTEVPVTEVPVTEVPVTEVPVTEVPATEVPVTEIPVTEVPVTEVPVTEVPVTEVPVTEVPVTEAPATEIPVIETPIPQGEMINRWGVTTAKGKTNVRSEMSKSSKELGALPSKGSKVWVVREEEPIDGHSWYTVVYNGKIGYIRSDLVAPLTQAESDAYQATLAEPMVPLTPEDLLPATEVPATEVPVTEVPVTEVPVTEVPATEVPATEVPVTEVPVTEVPVTEVPVTEVPVTEVPVTEVPVTEVPMTEVPVTEAPAQYMGYALTTEKIALRDGVSSKDSAIMTTLPESTLVYVQGQVYDDNGRAWSQVETLEHVTGMVSDAALRRINNEEAKYYVDQWNEAHPQETPTPVPTEAPMQISGYAYTIGDNVPFRQVANDRSVILNLLDRSTAVYVAGQEYATEDGWPWHSVMYGGQWGYIRSDMLRMMTAAEAQAYVDSLNTPEPTPEATPQPFNENSPSSYGYIFSKNGGPVRVRENPSTGAPTKSQLKPYAMCLIMGTQTVSGVTWYHIQYNGAEGFVHGDYFKQMSLKELSEFVASDLYTQGVANNTVTNATAAPTLSVENQNVNQWTGNDSNVNVSYATWAPIATTAPLMPTEGTATTAPDSGNVIGGTIKDRTELKNNTSVASATVSSLAAGTTLTINSTSTDAQGTTWYNVTTSDGRNGFVNAAFVDVSASPAATDEPSPTPTYEPLATAEVEAGTGGIGAGVWIGLIVVLALGGAGVYAYMMHQANKRKAAQRAAQRRAQAAGAQQGRAPQQAAAPRTGTYPNQNAAQRPQQPGQQARPYGQQAQQARPYGQPAQPGQQQPRPYGQPGQQAQQARPYSQPAQQPVQQSNPYTRPVEQSATQPVSPYAAPTDETRAYTVPVTRPATEAKPIAAETSVTEAKPVTAETPVTEAKPVAAETPVTEAKPTAVEAPAAETVPEAPAESSDAPQHVGRRMARRQRMAEQNGEGSDQSAE